MVFLRIKHRFHQRASEWFCAANLVQFGMALLHPGPTFESPSYSAFRWMGEDTMGAFTLACGLLWLVGLIVNGARQRTTVTIRLICAYAGSMIYGMLGLGFLWSYFIAGFLSTGIGNYLLVSALCVYSMFHTVKDARSGPA